MAWSELDRNHRGRAGGDVCIACDSRIDRLLPRRLRQFLLVCVGVLRGAFVYGIGAEYVLRGHGRVRILPMAGTRRRRRSSGSPMVLRAPCAGGGGSGRLVAGELVFS